VFVAKREAFTYPLVGWFLRRAGHIAVERKEARQSASDAAHVTDALKRGQSVLVFPEGTFTPLDGVRPFRLGAFRSANDAACPIIPLALTGTRKMLRDGQIMPRRGSVSLWVGEPLPATGDSFGDLVALRDKTRDLIGAQSGETIVDLMPRGVEQP
jgi:1-acyl-sn-glycerol-3-phosphate acyltransferase